MSERPACWPKPTHIWRSCTISPACHRRSGRGGSYRRKIARTLPSQLVAGYTQPGQALAPTCTAAYSPHCIWSIGESAKSTRQALVESIGRPPSRESPSPDRSFAFSQLRRTSMSGTRRSMLPRRHFINAALAIGLSAVGVWWQR